MPAPKKISVKKESDRGGSPVHGAGIAHEALAADKQLVRRLEEWETSCRERGSRHFSFFLDMREQGVAKTWLTANSSEKWRFWGGFEGSERALLGIFPEWEEPLAEEFPIKAIEYTFRPEDTVSHRDCLGSLMALGINRNTVGDILIETGRATAFLYKTAAVLAGDLERLGRVGVSARVLEAEEVSAVKPEQKYSVITGTAASLRADCILALALRLSRQKAVGLLEQKGILIGHLPCFEPSYLLKEGDIFSVRGKGKFKLESVGGLSNKNRLHLTIWQYL